MRMLCIQREREEENTIEHCRMSKCDRTQPHPEEVQKIQTVEKQRPPHYLLFVPNNAYIYIHLHIYRCSTFLLVEHLLVLCTHRVFLLCITYYLYQQMHNVNQETVRE